MNIIYWIDDDPTRFTSAKTLIEGSIRKSKKLAKVFTFLVANENPMEVLKKVLSKPKPTLIIIDHVLTASKGNALREGSTFAAAVRERWTDVPIVCLTAARQNQKKKFGYIKEAQYEAVFNWTEDYSEDIHAIADGFAQLKNANTLISLVRLLGCPPEEQDLLIGILSSITPNPKDIAFRQIITRWIRQTLMTIPGFLINSLSAATLLGLNEKGFNKVAKIFLPALYVGPFNTKNNPRWWRSKLEKVLSDQVPQANCALPWFLGRELSGISKNDYSKCHLTGRDLPETVAYTDQNKHELAPVKMELTEADPGSPLIVGFEPYRIIKAR